MTDLFINDAYARDQAEQWAALKSVRREALRSTNPIIASIEDAKDDLQIAREAAVYDVALRWSQLEPSFDAALNALIALGQVCRTEQNRITPEDYAALSDDFKPFVPQPEEV